MIKLFFDLTDVNVHVYTKAHKSGQTDGLLLILITVFLKTYRGENGLSSSMAHYLLDME